MMQCYEHAKVNQPKDAVAICSNCGAALCMEHLVVDSESAPQTGESRRRIYCTTCAGQPQEFHQEAGQAGRFAAH